MTHEGPTRRSRLRRLAALPLLIALLGALSSVGVVAAGSGTTVVRGVQQAARDLRGRWVPHDRQPDRLLVDRHVRIEDDPPRPNFVHRHGTCS